MFAKSLLLVFINALVFGKTIFWIKEDWNSDSTVNLDKPTNQYDAFERGTFYYRRFGLDVKFISGIQIYKNFSKYKQIFADTSTSYVLLENVRPKQSHMKIYYNAVPLNKRALIAWEPPTVMPEMYSQEVLKKFAKVLTWNNHLVDNVKFIKFYFPNFKSMISNTLAFEKKKLSCMVFARKYSTFPLELYSLRGKIIRFFSKRPNDFHLYGIGWPNNTPNYKGCVDNKAHTIKNYKFCFAMENTKGLSGYLTEKMWDVFEAGSIPIYLGDSNIENEIPSDCYIDFTKFARFSELVTFLQEMSHEEYERRIQCIKEFLASDAVKNYTYERFAQSLCFALLN